MKSNHMTADEIRTRGCAALVRELGPVGYVRFMQQFTKGKGDYTRERRQWVDTLKLDEFKRELGAVQQPRRSDVKRRKA